jgi:hypothetical protein
MSLTAQAKAFTIPHVVYQDMTLALAVLCGALLTAQTSCSAVTADVLTWAEVVLAAPGIANGAGRLWMKSGRARPPEVRALGTCATCNRSSSDCMLRCIDCMLQPFTAFSDDGQAGLAGMAVAHDTQLNWRAARC